MLLGTAFFVWQTGCKKTTQDSLAQDPANINMAAVGEPAPRGTQPERVLGQRETADPYQQGEQYPDAQGDYEADQPPPPLPEYAQPVATRPNSIWTPGYWQHSPQGYYWVPGTWVTPPYAGALWTPGYWQADGPRYRFRPGYWGRHVGFYGGIPYGGGYIGTGYRGGYWNGGHFYYNRAVNRVDPNVIHEYYDQPEPSYSGARISYNGGNGGISLLPIAAELIALHEQHERPVRYQYDLERRAGGDRGQFFGFNQGRPQTYIAPDDYLVERRMETRTIQPQIVERQVIQPQIIVEQGGPGRGHAYGHYKDHGDEGNGHDDHGKGHGDEGNGHGRGEGHDKDHK